MTQPPGSQPPRIRIVASGPPEGRQADPVVDNTHRTMTEIVKDIGLFFAAPFVTLVYVSLFPLIGMALFARAWRHRKDRA
jgi:hypothetical protein